MNERMTDCACHDVNVSSPRPSHGVWIASSIATTTAQTNVVFEVMATQRVYDVCARDPRSRRLGFYVVWTRSLLPCHPSVEETSSVSDAFCTCETVRILSFSSLNLSSFPLLLRRRRRLSESQLL